MTSFRKKKSMWYVMWIMTMTMISTAAAAMVSSGHVDAGCGGVVSRFAFFSGKPRWPARKGTTTTTLSYAISERNFPNHLSRAEVEEAVQRSFARWSEVAPLKFAPAKNYSSADVKIGFFHGDHGDGQPFDGTLGVLAHAFSPRNGGLHLDAAEAWALDFSAPDARSPAAVHLESVITHEIGHVIGLGHSKVEDAVMFPRLSPRSKKLDLHVDDVRGVQALYGEADKLAKPLATMPDHHYSAAARAPTTRLVDVVIISLLIIIA